MLILESDLFKKYNKYLFQAKNSLGGGEIFSQIKNDLNYDNKSYDYLYL